jgi:DNA polymerase elongation subunit (family B)
MSFKLSRIFSEFKYGDYVIHKFGYDDDGNAVSSKTNFRDYFYFDIDNAELLTPYDKIGLADRTLYDTFDGKKVAKIEYTSSKEKKIIEETYPEYAYEADVKPEFKYIVDNDVEWSLKRHILYFDIETDYNMNNPDWNLPDKARMPITSIVGYSNIYEKYFIFTWHEKETEHISTPEIMNRDNKVYVFCRDEEDVINSFVQFVKNSKIDIITGWYSSGYDLPYIINRCKVINVDCSGLSPLNVVRCYKRQGTDEWRSYIIGLDHIDMMQAIEDMGYNLPNWKLATAAKEIIGGNEFDKLTDVTWRNWRTDYKGFLKYAVRDVEILKEIEERVEIFDLYIFIQKMSNITNLGDIMFKSSVVDKYILTECHNKLILPTRVTKKRKNFMGATVLDPINPGLSKDVAVVDYASLYPTTIMAFNISPDTFVASEKMLNDKGLLVEDFIKDYPGQLIDTKYNDELFGKRYLFKSQQDQIGMMPTVLKDLYLKRRSIKSEMKFLDADSAHYKAMDKHQWAIKIILNSVYGAMGFNYFRLYTPECADAVTFFSRRALEYCIDTLDEDGFEVIYGDTDSCFFKHENRDVNAWVDKFNEDLKNCFVYKFNPKPNFDYFMYEIEFEKDLERIYFGDKKKRYYGIERGSGKKYIRGLNIIRKDTPSFLKPKLNELAELCVMDNLELEHLLELKREIKSIPYKELGITKSFSKKFENYVKMKPQHLCGAKFANEHLNTNITHIDKPLMFYIVSHCEDEIKDKDRTKAICLLEEDLGLIETSKHIFEVDYNEYFNKQVIQQLDEFKKIESVNAVLKKYKATLKEK